MGEKREREETHRKDKKRKEGEGRGKDGKLVDPPIAKIENQ